MNFKSIAAILLGLTLGIQAAPIMKNPLTTNTTAEADAYILSLVSNSVPTIGGMDASNILTGTIDAARLPTITSNSIAAGTIGTNLLSQSAYDALVGGGEGGTGDATLAGTNTWAGTNIFNEEIQGQAFTIFTNGYGAFVGGLEAPTVYAPTYVNTPIVTNAEGGSVTVEGVRFDDGGMDASNILTGRIDAARLPTVWTNADGGLLLDGVGVTNGEVRATTVISTVLSAGTVNASAIYSTSGIQLRAWNGSAFDVMRIFPHSVIIYTNAFLSNNLTVYGTISGSGAGLTSIPYTALDEAARTSITNAAAGGSMPAGIITNNHAAAVTFSNDVTVASNLVVQGSSTFETLNVGELNVTNLAASIIDGTNIISGTITSNDIAPGTIGTNLLSQSAYNALVGGGSSNGVVGITTNVAVLVPGDLTNTLQFYLGVLTNVVAGVVTNEEPEVGDYTAYATKFGTTTDVLSKVGAFTDLADGTNGVLSFWVKWTGAVGDQRKIFYGAGGDIYVQRQPDDMVRIGFADTSEVASLVLISTNALTTNAWHHVAATWDSFDASKCRLWIDAVECGSITTRVATNLDYTLSAYFVSYDDATGVDGELCEFWMGFNQFIDLGESSNLQKFRSTGGKPVDLGEDGSTPTGTSPTVYLRHPYTGFQTNAGTGGDFSVSGTLEEGTPP